MIKLYKIKIGEKIYEVEVESVTEKEGSILISDDFNNKQKEEQRKKENNLSNNNYDKNNIPINKKLNKHNEILENLDEFDKKKNEKYKKFNMEKIKDETMLAALMAALIDASEDNENCYIKVRNIKEIK